jgi:hypothetical protein
LRGKIRRVEECDNVVGEEFSRVDRKLAIDVRFLWGFSELLHIGRESVSFLWKNSLQLDCSANLTMSGRSHRWRPMQVAAR